MAKKNEMIEAGSFELKVNDEFVAAVTEELEGLGTLMPDMVKMPSGGGLAFEVPGEDEDSPDVEKTITGVIVAHVPMNAYWKEAFDGENTQPDCVSYDGKTGVDASGAQKACKNCPLNQFGSGADGYGKACQNKHRLYIMRSGSIIPLMLTLPPTSLKSFRMYIQRSLIGRGYMHTWEVITEIGLKKEKSAGGIEYSAATFKRVGVLTPEQKEEARKMGETYKAVNDQIDETVEEQTDGDFMDIPDGVDDLPFADGKEGEA